MKTKKHLLLFLLILCNISIMKAQSEQEKAPLWVTMMNTPNVNYYQAVNEFTKYWENKEKPSEEKEVFKDRKVKKKKAIPYAFEYKKFLQWQQKSRAYIKEDGTVATPDERKQLWEAEKKNRKLDQ